MKKIFVCTLFIMASLITRAQKEANNWFFGLKCGITWNTTQDVSATGMFGTSNAILKGLPTNVPGSMISTTEGCFSLSDFDGNLLFYSDGITIWNKNNEPMPNGSSLTGDPSSAQSGIVLPYPGSTSKFIAVTLGQYTTNNLSYSVVDITLNGGLGDVIPAQKNVKFAGAKGLTGESVTSIRHANKRDYWVICPGRGPTTYLNAWRVTDSGVASAPVTTEYPIETGTGSGIIGGYFKFTSDGKHFFWGSDSRPASPKIMYGDFDNNTGQFSNIKVLPFAGNSYPYGVEFSLSNKYVYLTRRSSTLEVFDFDALLAADDPTTVKPKTYTYSSNGALQMGPDNRIYVVVYAATYLYVIDNPEEGDNLRIYRTPTGFLSGTAQLGLPSFAASWFGLNLSGDQNPCIGVPASYSSLINYSTLDPHYDNLRYFEWNWGDGTPVERDYDIAKGSVQNRDHTYQSKGSFTLTVTPYVENTPGIFTPLTDAGRSLEINPRLCFLPVNPHIRTTFK